MKANNMYPLQTHENSCSHNQLASSSLTFLPKLSPKPRSRYLLEFSSYRPAVKHVIVALLVAKLNPIAVTTRSNAIGDNFGRKVSDELAN